MRTYLLFEDKKQENDELLLDVVDFLWDKGNQVFLWDRFASTSPRLRQKNEISFDGAISLIHSPGTIEELFEINEHILTNKFRFSEKKQQKLILIISERGVYSNVIPYPHKIFNFDNLDKNSLLNFFQWCDSLNLFQPCAP